MKQEDRAEPKQVVVPLELSRLIFDSWNGDVSIVDQPNQLYAKTIHGQGEVKFLNGNYYSGNFSHGLIHGKGKFTWANGVVYEGDFHYNAIQGTGKYSWPDGSSYEGELKKGLRNGRGVYRSKESQYVGQWKNGFREGEGQINFSDGSQYVGQFQKGSKHGQGKITYPSGNYYQGSWVNDKKEGFGVMMWLNSQQKYIGHWTNNKQNGTGQHIWLEQRGQNKLLRHRYSGQWEEGVREGLGVFYFTNGSKVEGEWKRNKKQGLGITTDQFGKVWVGEYHSDRLVATEEYKLRQKQITEANPYQLMLDLSDLIGPEGYAQSKVTKMSQAEYLNNLLLRNNSSLKLYYRFFYQRYEHQNEKAFCLTLGSCWKMLRELKLLGGRLSLASINRLMFKGSRTHFDIEVSVEDLKQLVQMVKRQKHQTLTNIEYNEATFHNILKQLSQMPPLDWSSPSTQPSAGLEFKRANVHNEAKIILFRHFVQFLVRVSFLKFPGIELHRAVQKLLGRIEPLIESMMKVEKQPDIDSEGGFSTISSKIKRLIPQYARQASAKLFHKLTADNKSLPWVQDHTLRVADLVSSLEKAGLLSQGHQRLALFARIERDLDPEPEFQTGGNLPKVGRKRPLNAFEGQKASKIKLLLEIELIQTQFDELLWLILQKKINSSSPDERRTRYESLVDQVSAHVEGRPRYEPVVPASRKSQIVREKREKLRLLQLQQEQLRLRREEEEREASEMAFMAFQDHDVQSEQMEEQQDEEEQFYY